ncbi:MAG: GNAT family N-acetyltransferase [Bacteroidetes bacterium]|nr:GNAT family N-acetyltransferase [Bacteroidota bacterium]
MITIRNARSSDVGFIYDSICILEEKELDKFRFEQILEFNLSSPVYIYLVAEDNGKLIGLLTCHAQQLLHHSNWVYEIQEMFVLPEYRIKGVGAMLIKELESRLAGKDFDVLEVSSNVMRTQAHAFYERHGFIHTSKKLVKKK